MACDNVNSWPLVLSIRHLQVDSGNGDDSNDSLGDVCLGRLAGTDDSADDWADTPPVEADKVYDRHYLTSGHRGSSKFMRQVLKWRILWARRQRPADAVLFD